MSRTPNRQLLLLIALLLPILGTTPNTSCWGTVYGLTLDSRFPDFCASCAPCMCLPAPPATMTGTFRLVKLENSETSSYDEYLVSDVHWIVRERRGPDGNDVLVTGSGRYEIQRDPEPQHRMQLDLRYGDSQEVGHYDSGHVAGGSEFPNLDIGMPLGPWPDFRPDSRIEVRAVPFPKVE